MNNKVEKQLFEQYLGEARTWETDKVQQLEKSKKTAWWVAGVASAIAFMAVGAVAALAPFKTVEPYVIRVDNSTGIVDVVTALKDGRENYDEAINKFFTQWYVRYREGYSKQLAPEYYTNVGLMSVGSEQQKYYNWFNPKNPTSPLNIYGEFAKVKVTVKGTSFIKPNVALVRYTKAVERGNDKPQITHWAATITFKYSGAPMSEKDRAINPLGFQVVEYRNDPDSGVVSEGDSPTAADASTPAAAPAVTVFPGQASASAAAPAQVAANPTAATVPVVPAVQPQPTR